MPVVHRLVSAYKFWLETRNHIPKNLRYTLGEKIDRSFLDGIELIHTASYMSKGRKLPYLEKAGNRVDMLKFFLQLAWEVKAIDNKKYIMLSGQLHEIGKMVGGWSKGLQKTNPARSGE